MVQVIALLARLTLLLAIGLIALLVRLLFEVFISFSVTKGKYTDKPMQYESPFSQQTFLLIQCLQFL